MRHFTPPSAPLERASRIAVIGSGVAGLSAAWLLSQRHEVTLYEKDAWIGGHAHTVDVPGAGKPLPVDTGFIVYNERNYPNLTALFRHLGVETEPSWMSFSASIDGGGLEYSSDSVNAYFGQRRNFVRPRFLRMTADLLRFYRKAMRLAAGGDMPDMTLGEYLHHEGYSEAFAEYHILPMSAAIWSTTPREIRAYPVAAFLRFYASHGLLDITKRPAWRTVTGGSRSYVEKLRAAIRDVRPGRGVSRIERSPLGVTITDDSGDSQRFSDVVIAAHADEALEMLADADPAEREILGAFGYTHNDAVLHTDATLMPRRRRVWSSWNFVGSSAQSGRQMSVTYWMNRLQNIDEAHPLFVTLNAGRQPRPDTVIGRYSYSHPYFDRTALAAQQDLWRLQGRRGTWFCGAYFGYGFHEDGLQSGLAVAEALGGVRRPWARPDDRIAPAAPKEPAEAAA